MSLYKRVKRWGRFVVYCDVDGCDACTETDEISETIARQEARKLGWSTETTDTRTNADICPVHQRTFKATP